MRVLQLKQRKNGRTIRRPLCWLGFNADASILVGRADATAGLVAVGVHGDATPDLPQELFARATCVAFSTNGQYFAFRTSGGTTRVYRSADGVQLAEHDTGGATVGMDRLAFAPTADPRAQWLAVCGREFWLWNPLTQQYLVAPEAEGFQHVAFGPLGHWVVVTTGIAVAGFQLSRFGEVWRVPFENWFGGGYALRHSMVHIPDDGSAVVVSFRAAAHVLDPSSGEWRGTIRFETTVTNIAFLPNSRLLAVADGSPTLRVYDTDTGTVAREYDWGIGGIHCVTFSNDGAMGAAGGDKGRVVVWDVD